MTQTFSGDNGASAVQPNSVNQAAIGSNVIGGTGPAFSAYGSALQSISTGVWTKVAYNTEQFDTANAYDQTTNYRFNPQVAGYYQINASILCSGAVATAATGAALGKNGSITHAGSFSSINAGSGTVSTVSALIYLNGSTDYVEAFAYQTTGGALNVGSNSSVYYFSGALVRAA